jgi:hypothetical protein
VGRQFDAIDLDASGRQRECNAPSADGELEGAPPAGKFRQKRRGGGFVATRIIVVGGGHFRTEACRRVKTFHPATPS